MENVKQKVDKNFDWFKKNKDKFIVVPDSKYVLINDCEPIGAFKSTQEAYEYAVKQNLTPGFIIQKVGKENETNFLGYFSSVIG